MGERETHDQYTGQAPIEESAKVEEALSKTGAVTAEELRAKGEEEAADIADSQTGGPKDDAHPGRSVTSRAVRGEKP